MEPTTPQASGAAPAAPTVAAPQQLPGPTVGTATTTGGAAQPAPAAPARRSRAPRGPGPSVSSSSGSGIPALLEISAAVPMHTVQRRETNFFVPDANMLFHVLGICDQMMTTTDRFIRSAPAWLPIVSQLYISVLWWTMILRVYVNSGYGFSQSNLLEDLERYLQIGECMIPGPLVPFFSSLAAVNGPFDWIGDIVACIPDFASLWNAGGFNPSPDFARSLPIPAILLDQLIHFATWVIPPNQTLYGNFEWYRSIFSHPSRTQSSLLRVGPQLSAGIFSTEAQTNAARNFWAQALAGLPRIDSNLAQTLDSEVQLLGFGTQARTLSLNWFQQVVIVMQKYCQYFNGSVPLKSIAQAGVGACVIIGTPTNNQATRDWLYPQNPPAPFLPSTFAAPHEMPDNMSVHFAHADHEVEELAEQYALLTHTNLKYGPVPGTQHGWTAVNDTNIHVGAYWTFPKHRESGVINFKHQFAQLIASRYHQQAANKAT